MAVTAIDTAQKDMHCCWHCQVCWNCWLTWLGLVMQVMQWSLEGSERARWAQEAKWWIPDANISKTVIPVQKLRHVLSHLRQMPQSEVTRKLRLMEAERFRFTFQVCYTADLSLGKLISCV